MTVEELIEELQRQPNQRVPVFVRATAHGEAECPECEEELESVEVIASVEIDAVRFDGGRVVLEGED